MNTKLVCFLKANLDMFLSSNIAIYDSLFNEYILFHCISIYQNLLPQYINSSH